MSGTSYWRVAGVSYLKYIELSSKALRNCLKVKDVAVRTRSEIHFQERKWSTGLPGEKGKIRFFINLYSSSEQFGTRDTDGYIQTCISIVISTNNRLHS